MASKECFHFTNLKNLDSINQSGLRPMLSEHSAGVKDKTKKLSYADGKIGAIGILSNFYEVIEEIRLGIRTPDPNEPEQLKTYARIKSTKSMEEYLGDGVYLLFDGTRIENTGGNHGNGGIYDASTMQTISPDKLTVGLVRDDDTGHVSYSMYDYIHYLMSTLTLEEYEQMIPSMQERFDVYYHEHKDEIDRFKNGHFSKKEVPLSKFIEIARDKIDKEKQKFSKLREDDQEIK